MTSEYLAQLLAPPSGVARPPSVPEVVARLNQTITQLNKLLAAKARGSPSFWQISGGSSTV
jgi:hypothetical protein